MKKLHIGVLTEIISGASGARAPLEIAKHLADLGHEVTVYAYNYSKDRVMHQYLEKNHVQVKVFTKPRWSRYFIIPKIFYTLKRSNHHVLYFSGTPPFFIAGLLTRAPIVRMYQGTQFDAYLEKFLPNQRIPFYHRLLNRILNHLIYLIDFISFRLSSAVVAISAYAAHEGESLYKRAVFKVIYHGSNALSHQIKNPPPASSVHLISVSRLTPYKGFHLIIEALKKIQTNIRWRLTIVGSQPKKHYVQYLKSLGQKKVRILSNIADAELADIYSNSDIYVTCDRYLYFGLPIMEAAHFKLPTVAFDFAAAKEIVIHNSTGLVVKNRQELSDGLKQLIEQPKLRQKFGAAAKKRAREFSWKTCAKRWEEVLVRFAKK